MTNMSTQTQNQYSALSTDVPDMEQSDIPATDDAEMTLNCHFLPSPGKRTSGENQVR